MPARIGSREDMAQIHDLDAERLPFLPKNVLADILSELVPDELVCVAGTCQTLRKFLLLPSSLVIWGNAHDNHERPNNHALSPIDDPATLHARRLLILRTEYYALLDKKFPLVFQTFPPFSDISGLRGAQKRISAASSDEEVREIANWLVNAVASWRSKWQTNLLALLPEHNAARQPEFLDRAAAMWTSIDLREDDAGPWWYPGVTLGAPFSIKDGVITTGLKFDSNSAETLQTLGQLGMFDANTMRQDELDIRHTRNRFRCQHCVDEPLQDHRVFDWRQAIQHQRKAHPSLHPQWTLWPAAVADRAVARDRTRPLWCCTICPSGQRGLLSMSDAHNHARNEHGIFPVQEGMQFARSSVGRVQPPTIMELFAVEEDASHDRPDGTASWKCTLCPSMFNGPQAPSLFMTHLLKFHSLALSEPLDTALTQAPPGLSLADMHRVAPSGPPFPPPPAFFYKPETSSQIQVSTAGFPTVPSSFGLGQPPHTAIPGHVPPPSPHTTTSSLSVSAPSLVTTAALMPDGSMGKTQLRYSTIKEFMCLVNECRGNPAARAFNLNGVKNHINGKHKVDEPVFGLHFGFLSGVDGGAGTAS